MEDDAAFRLQLGEPVYIAMKVSELYNGAGAVLVEVTEKNATQRFWVPVAALVERVTV